MKKIFSLLATIMAVATMSAETLTLKMSEYAETTFTTRGITVTATKGTDAAPAATGEELRVYAGGTLTISTSTNNIKAIEFELSDKGKERLADITTDVSTISITGSQTEEQSVSWAGSATSVTFTVGEKATYGTNSNKAGQFDLLSITITTDGEQPTDPEPTTEQITFAGGEIDAEYAEFGFVDVFLYTFNKWTEPDEEGYVNPVGDGMEMLFNIYCGDYTDLSDTYSIENEAIDSEYSYMVIVNGTDTTELDMTTAELTLKLVSTEETGEEGFSYATYEVSISAKGSNGIVYTCQQTIRFEVYGSVEETAIGQTKSQNTANAKRFENGQVVILRNNTKYSTTGAAIETIAQ